MKEFYKRDSCRLCGSKHLDLALPLKKSPLCDAYIKEKKEQTFYDLNLYLCKECSFVQIDTVIDPEVIYRDYIYVTTSSLGLVEHFEKYAHEVCDFLKLTESNLTVDIGSNEGTLLSYFKSIGHKVLGIEPSFKAAEIANQTGINTLPDFFNEELAKKIIDNYSHADLITINNLYANIDDLENFTKGVEFLLSKDGVLVIESSYLLDMINNMVFDFIYHEHLSYFSILPLMTFFKKFNMKLINLQEVGTKGGSMRYFFAKEGSKWNVHQSVEVLGKKEKDANVGLTLFQKWEEKINREKENLLEYLKPYKGKKIVGYGASATSTTLISHFGLHEYFSYLVDENPGKIDTFSPGYHIPVYGPEILNEDGIDVLIILAWRYKENILRKLPNLNAKIIIPLPYFEVLA
ncbi:MAG: class I SAM-dependent methyltransferase [Sulfuricurvum sp.]|jgi:SAM-dependent methyltransferase